MRVGTIIIHNLIEETHNSRGICCSVAGFWCWRSHGALTLHCLTDISSLFSAFHRRWLILKQTTQVRSYLWMTESQKCSGSGGNWKKAAAEVSSSTPLCWRKYNQESSALAADGVPSGLIFEWRKRDVRSDVSCSTFGDFSTASALRVGPWTFLILFNSRNALHPRSAVTHWHPAALLSSLCCSRTLERGLTNGDLLITSFTTSATAAYLSQVDQIHTRQSPK